MIDEERYALGWVPLEGRGHLPFALVHGESLVAAASWALGEAEVQLFDASVSFAQVRESGRDLVLHDPLCPLLPAKVIAGAAAVAARSGAVVVGYRPVTDTVKVAEGDVLGAGVDRAGLRAVASPVVVPAAVLAQLETLDASDFPALVARLAKIAPLHWYEVPPVGRRIADAGDLVLLEALSRSLS